MSADGESDFRCPVCRARQTLREECRRCRADLSLVVRAHRRVRYLIGQREQARADDDRIRERIVNAELRRLAPRC